MSKSGTASARSKKAVSAAAAGQGSRSSKQEAPLLQEPFAGYAVPEGKSPFDTIAMIRKGLRRSRLDELMDISGFSLDEMAAILHTSSRTLQRYTGNHLMNADQSERVYELFLLYDRGAKLFGRADSFRSWMGNSLVSLGGLRPRDLLDTSIGINILLDELGKIEHGIPA